MNQLENFQFQSQDTSQLQINDYYFDQTALLNFLYSPPAIFAVIDPRPCTEHFRNCDVSVFEPANYEQSAEMWMLKIIEKKIQFRFNISTNLELKIFSRIFARLLKRSKTRWKNNNKKEINFELKIPPLNLFKKKKKERKMDKVKRYRKHLAFL